MPAILCPNGHPLKGTMDLVPGIARVQYDEKTDTYAWAGGTDLDYDGQYTREEVGRPLLICTEGCTFTHRRFTLT